MQVYLTALGCRLNEAELEQWGRSLRRQGHTTVANVHGAQLIVVNTCAVTNEATRKSRKLLRGLHQQNPTAPLVVTGCYSDLQSKQVCGMDGVDLVVPNRDKDRLVEIVSDHLDLHNMPKMATSPDSVPYAHNSRTRAFVKVQDGCRNRCTFCIVTVARGSERSRPIAELIEELQALHHAGYQEAVLTGVHLGGYGADLETDLFHLVSVLLEQTTIPRIRLSSLEPWDLPPHFWELWQHPRLMPHLHLPLQSGSDTVLKRMARRCSTKSYESMVTAARNKITGLSITTDIIVGFPGETGEEWQQTIDFVQSIGFAHCHIFCYSPREGTTAARMKHPVSKQVQRNRSQQLHQIAAQMKRKHLLAHRWETRPVLWEGKGVKTGINQLRWSGYTDNYLRVETNVPQQNNLENKITPANITGINEHSADRLLATLPASHLRTIHACVPTR